MWLCNYCTMQNDRNIIQNQHQLKKQARREAKQFSSLSFHTCSRAAARSFQTHDHEHISGLKIKARLSWAVMRGQAAPASERLQYGSCGVHTLVTASLTSNSCWHKPRLERWVPWSIPWMPLCLCPCAQRLRPPPLDRIPAKYWRLPEETRPVKTI